MLAFCSVRRPSSAHAQILIIRSTDSDAAPATDRDRIPFQHRTHRIRYNPPFLPHQSGASLEEEGEGKLLNRKKRRK